MIIINKETMEQIKQVESMTTTLPVILNFTDEDGTLRGEELFSCSIKNHLNWDDTLKIREAVAATILGDKYVRHSLTDIANAFLIAVATDIAAYTEDGSLDLESLFALINTTNVLLNIKDACKNAEDVLVDVKEHITYLEQYSIAQLQFAKPDPLEALLHALTSWIEASQETIKNVNMEDIMSFASRLKTDSKDILANVVSELNSDKAIAETEVLPFPSYHDTLV